MRLGIFLICLSCAAEVRTVTLREALDLAMRQNPDVALARLDERIAEEAVRQRKDPFVPKVVVGSGLAYTTGMPMSIEGATPSIIQTRAVGSVFDRPQSYRLAAARESRRGAALDTAAKQEEVAWRTAELFVEAERAAKSLQAVVNEAAGLERVLEAVRARVAEGRELPIEGRKSELALARSRLRRQALENTQRAAESALGAVIGLDAGDLARPAPSERPAAVIPGTPAEAVQAALANSKEIRALESRMLATGLEVKAAKAAWLPKADLVAQYALLGRYNNYDEFFNRFERNNAQLGVSFQLPVWPGIGARAEASRAEAESAKIRVQLRNLRRRVDEDTRRAFADAEQAQAALQVARMDLDVARDQVSVLLALNEEGRATLRQIEDARQLETEKWLALYDAGAALDKARFALLYNTGGLSAAVQ